MAIRHGGNIFEVAGHKGLPWQQVLDFSASINPLGASPAAREAILCAIDRIVHYPERDGMRLREKLAAEWNVPASSILVGNGATELLFEWCRHVGTGTIAAPAFSEFHHAWPNAQFCQLDEASTWPVRGPVVFTRPANPSGYLADADAIRAYARKHPDPVLVDESFLDFCDAESVLPGASANLFVLRSLTKFWALPGLRLGALIGDVGEIEKQRPPWAVNALAEAAGLASLADREHARRTRAFVRTEAAWLAAELGVLPGPANYLLVEMDRATEFVAFAATRNVLLRDCTDWPGWPRNAVRVAVRRRWENEILVAIFKEFLCAV